MAMQQGTQVTLTIPDEAPPGTLLVVPVLGGQQKIKVRVPEGLGAGSTLIVQQMESGEDWDVVVGNVIPYGTEAYGGSSAKEAYLRQQAELEKAWMEQQREALQEDQAPQMAARGSSAEAQGMQVTLTVPDGAPPGTLLAVPVQGGQQKIKVRVPEGIGAGSTLIIRQNESGEDWDVLVGSVIPYETEALSQEAYLQQQQAELEKAWLQQQNEAREEQAAWEAQQLREAQEAQAAQVAAREASAAAARANEAAERAAQARELQLQQQMAAAEEQQRALAEQQERERLEQAALEQAADQQAVEYVFFNGEQLPLLADGHLRTLSFQDAHKHAHYLYAKFGHGMIGRAPPNDHNNVIAWIMHVQQNFIEPLRAQNGEPDRPLEPAMEAYTVRLDTTVGVIDIIVRPDWAPQGTRRFLELAAAGDLNELAFYRAMKGCIVQFGLPAKRQWPPISDDPPTGVPFLLGAVSFAAVGENSRKSTLFICIGDMSHCLGQNSWETPIGAVTESSLDVLDKIETCYGDIAEFGGSGPDTTRINTEGSAYLRRDFPLLTYIRGAHPLDWPAENSADGQQELVPQTSQADQAAFASQAAQAAQAAAEAAQAAKQAAQAAMAAQAAHAAEASKATATPSGVLSRNVPVADGFNPLTGQPWTSPGPRFAGDQPATAPSFGQPDVIDVPVEIVTPNRQQVVSVPAAAANAARTNSVTTIVASGQAKDMRVQRYPSLVPASPQPTPGAGAVVMTTVDNKMAAQTRPTQVQQVQMPMSPQPVQTGLRPPQALLPPQPMVSTQMVPGAVGMVQRQQVAGTSLSFPTGSSILGTNGVPQVTGSSLSFQTGGPILGSNVVSQVVSVTQPQAFVQSPVMGVSPMPTGRR